MDEIRKVIATACLTHSDSGEASKDMEARRILKALKDEGYSIVKNNTALGSVIGKDNRECNGSEANFERCTRLSISCEDCKYYR